MAAIIRAVIDQYDFLMSKADPRMEHLPVVNLGPFSVLGCLALYACFSTNWGQKWMKDRPPFDCKFAMIVYNFVQIVLNGYLLFQALYYIFIPRNFNFLCAEVDYSNDPLALKVTHCAYVYFIVKNLDVLDTVFMVLRKKNNQITFLHVYHHAGMIGAAWLGTKFTPGGYCLFFGSINSFVHMVMYSYYLLTALYPEYKQNIWWKKHITELQMVQFIVILLHGVVNILNPSCGFPKTLIALFMPQNAFMLVMFWDFYKKAYLKNNTDKKEEKQS